MEARAVTRSVRITPQKTRLVIDLIRGKDAIVAQDILDNQTQKAARIIRKTLDSAIANAVNNFNLKLEDLYVKTCYVDQAQVIKRHRPLSKGRVGRNDHVLSHITVILDEKNK